MFVVEACKTMITWKMMMRPTHTHSRSCRNQNNNSKQHPPMGMMARWCAPCSAELSSRRTSNDECMLQTHRSIGGRMTHSLQSALIEREGVVEETIDSGHSGSTFLFPPQPLWLTMTRHGSVLLPSGQQRRFEDESFKLESLKSMSCGTWSMRHVLLLKHSLHTSSNGIEILFLWPFLIRKWTRKKIMHHSQATFFWQESMNFSQKYILSSEKAEYSSLLLVVAGTVVYCKPKSPVNFQSSFLLNFQTFERFLWSLQFPRIARRGCICEWNGVFNEIWALSPLLPAVASRYYNKPWVSLWDWAK